MFLLAKPSEFGVLSEAYFGRFNKADGVARDINHVTDIRLEH